MSNELLSITFAVCPKTEQFIVTVKGFVPLNGIAPGPRQMGLAVIYKDGPRPWFEAVARVEQFLANAKEAGSALQGQFRVTLAD